MLPDVPASLPGWVGILKAAEAWGCPPWAVTGEEPPRRSLWYLRWATFENEIGRAGRDKQKHTHK